MFSYVPTPFLLDTTPSGGMTLEVTADLGWVAGTVLLGQIGPPATVEVRPSGGAWAAISYPHTLAAGETLRLIRTDTSAALVGLRALAPVVEYDGGGGFTVSRDGDGFLTTSAALSRDGDGFLTTDQPLSRDADGFLSTGGTP